MPRVKRGVIAHKKREKVLKHTKGYRWGRKSKERAAKEALLHAWSHAFRGRKERKRDFRALWQVKINAAARANGLTYSQLINALKKQKISLDRKILAQLAEEEPETFKQIAARLDARQARLTDGQAQVSDR
ncbi:MAG: 50S ribosomal protein L20 [Candidatus Colwellbacteria bacterium]|nr:50S ribosomal protein L20 [Candidatus Colwellbacteria bacterium]